MKFSASPILPIEDEADVLAIRRVLREIDVTNPLMVCERGKNG
jgi:hypothetical protein